MLFRHSPQMVTREEALPGRTDRSMPVPDRHDVLDAPLAGPWPADTASVVVGMGCFWGAERKFWQTPGVYSTAVGYAGGFTPNPTYEETCTGRTGHTEVVLVVYRPAEVSFEQLMRVFWENHDPTQGMRQGNDIGTQYRSAVYVTDPAQAPLVEATRSAYQQRLSESGFGAITTEVAELDAFWYAEPYHQQYLSKNPNGYCGIGGTGVTCPVGVIPAGD